MEKMMSQTNEPHVTFGITSHEFTEVLRLDKDGMHYKGEVVKDAGEAHRIFLTVMKRMEEESAEHRKPWLWWQDVKVMTMVGLCVGLIWGASWVA
jgi:hypothetical protein